MVDERERSWTCVEALKVVHRHGQQPLQRSYQQAANKKPYISGSK
jgi:hypothetical protein